MSQLKQSVLDYININISKERVCHILSVAEIAKELATAHNLDPNDAEIAALLHDVAREWNFDKLTEFAKQNSLTITADEEKLPILLHGKVGAEFAKRTFNITNHNILNAIRYHTNGAPDMSPLEMIIFLSDSLSWLKENNPSSYKTIFNQASISLVTATNSIYQLTYKHFIKNNTPIAKDFLNSWESYKG